MLFMCWSIRRYITQYRQGDGYYLRAFKDHLCDMLVAVVAGALFNIFVEYKDIHFYQRAWFSRMVA